MARHVFDRNGNVCLVLHADNTTDALHNGLNSDPDNNNGDARGSSAAIQQHESSRPSPSDNAAPERKTTSRIEMLVSSAHLILASRVFEAMLLQPRFAEGLELQNSGKIDIPLYDDDPSALEIVLNIVHGHPGKVPGYVTTELLLKIAVIVDKYQMHEAIEHFAKLWIDHIHHTVNLSYAEAVPYIISMLCISRVFKRQDVFGQVSYDAQIYLARRADQYAGFEELPIPGTIIDKIEQGRLGAIEKALLLIMRTIEIYQSPGQHCNGMSLPYNDPEFGPMFLDSKWSPDLGFACDGTILGGLIKRASQSGLYPIPSKPYEGLAYEQVAGRIRSMSVPSLCQQTMKAMHEQRFSVPWEAETCHQLERTFGYAITDITSGLQGLRLEDFRAPAN